MKKLIPIDRLEQLRKEQQETEERTGLRLPLYEPELMLVSGSLTGSHYPEETDQRGVAIIDFSV
jgi:hypothetical protein